MLTLADTGRDSDPDDDDDIGWLQWVLFLSVRSHVFWEELAMIPYRVDYTCRCLYQKEIDILRLASAS